jgi:hypothetical protein
MHSALIRDNCVLCHGLVLVELEPLHFYLESTDLHAASTLFEFSTHVNVSSHLFSSSGLLPVAFVSNWFPHLPSVHPVSRH